MKQIYSRTRKYDMLCRLLPCTSLCNTTLPTTWIQRMQTQEGKTYILTTSSTTEQPGESIGKTERENPVRSGMLHYSLLSGQCQLTLLTGRSNNNYKKNTFNVYTPSEFYSSKVNTYTHEHYSIAISQGCSFIRATIRKCSLALQYCTHASQYIFPVNRRHQDSFLSLLHFEFHIRLSKHAQNTLA